MRTDEELKKELDTLSDEAMEAAEKLCEVFKKFPAIDTGKPENEEEEKKILGFQLEQDRRRAIILRRILIEFGGFLFI